MTTTARCPKCGTKLAWLDGDLITIFDIRHAARSRAGGRGGWADVTETHTVDASFMSAVKRRDVSADCPNPKCRTHYPVAGALAALQRAQQLGKKSVEVPEATTSV